jgi:hypothetical protein
MQFDRRAYASFADVAIAPRTLPTSTAMALCDNGEPFEDVNANGNWDMPTGLQVGLWRGA